MAGPGAVPDRSVSVVNWQYLTGRIDDVIETLENERSENAEFREEMRRQFAGLEKWAAVHEATDETRRQQQTVRTKQHMWIAGILFTLLNSLLPTILPFLFRR